MNLISLRLCIVGPFKGYDNIWIVGDKFVENTFNQSVMQKEGLQFHIKDNYNVKEFSSMRFHDGNVLSRIYNDVIKGINTKVLLPKLIVIVLDCDIIKNISYDTFSLSCIYTICMDYLIKSLHHAIKEHKNQGNMECIRPYLTRVTSGLHSPNTFNAVTRKSCRSVE